MLSARTGATRDKYFLKEDHVANLAGRRTNSTTSGLRHDEGTASRQEGWQKRRSSGVDRGTSPLDRLRSNGVHPKPWPELVPVV